MSTELLQQILFWPASVIAIISTLLVVLSRNPFYAVLYLIQSFFGVSMIFWSLGAQFLAVLEIIVYAGAIMVLFLFVVQMLVPGVNPAPAPDLQRPPLRSLILPGTFSVLLLGLTLAALVGSAPKVTVAVPPLIDAKTLGMHLFRNHYLGVELASLVLLIGMIGGMHLGRAASDNTPKEEKHGNASR